MSDLLAFRFAREHVDAFESESDDLMKHHRAAMECRDCEAILQLGIDAFQWLVRADETIRAAIFSEAAEQDDEIDVATNQLFRGWLVSSERIRVLITMTLERGYVPDNLEEFRRCQAEVAAIVRSLDSAELTRPMCDLRDAALREHADGETSEFL